MACEFDPLSLFNSPRRDVEGPIPSKPDIELGAQDSDFFDNLQRLQWDAPKPGISVDENILNPTKHPDSLTKVEDLDHRSISLNSYPAARPSERWKVRSSAHLLPKRGTRSSQEKDEDPRADSGRPAKRRRSQSKFRSLSSSLDEDFGFDETQRPDKLEKNRVAASKCREKKKRETAKLQARERELAAERDALKSMAEALRTEVLGLKNEVLKHGMCDCSVIQKYITETARQIV
ncbi:hypothetical protein F5Y05DRAFT_395246 [Hypoxylon sp. FL0543]|nr:hypothetical protein F5Y05DRAFT_395246 [Hypoxylon sp. FL0543]